MADWNRGPWPQQPSVAPQTPRQRRRLWPWLLAGGSLCFLGLAIIVIAIGVVVGRSIVVAGRENPRATVQSYDRAWRNADCALLERVTDASARSDVFSGGGGFSCSAFRSAAAQYEVDGVYEYHLSITDVAVDGASATVRTNETDDSGSSPESYQIEYDLVRSGSGWIIDDIESLDDSGGDDSGSGATNS